MDGHLIPVEIGIKCLTYQRRDLNRLSLNQHRLKGLDTQSMKRWSPVKQHRMVFDNLFEDVPDHRFLALHHFFGALYRGGVTILFQTVVNERLEKLECHLLGKAALVEL